MVPRVVGPSASPGWVIGGLCLPVLAVFCGCVSPALDSARTRFYQGQFLQAEADLADDALLEKDRVLALMERGMIRQMRGAYAESCVDFLAAAARLEQLRTYSLSKGAASMVVNDNVQDFEGAPFERTLLHAFTAKNYLARAQWDDAAVEARLLIRALAPESRGDYPEDAYSRYVAGFCLEMIDDPSNAAVQYRRVSDLARHLRVDERGRITPVPSSNALETASAPLPPSLSFSGELVCFVLMGRAPRHLPDRHGNWHGGIPGYAEISVNGACVGRSYVLADTRELALTSEQIAAVGKSAKTIARVVLKEVAAEAVAARNNEALGELVRFILIGLLEEPDVRRWETLPHWLQVARVPCPRDLREFRVVFRDAAGNLTSTLDVKDPIARHGDVFFSFCRNEPPSPPRPVPPAP